MRNACSSARGRAIDEEGNPVHPGDMRAQINQALTNFKTVLANAGFRLSDVVRLNYSTTNVEGFFEAFWVAMTR